MYRFIMMFIVALLSFAASIAAEWFVTKYLKSETGLDIRTMFREKTFIKYSVLYIVLGVLAFFLYSNYCYSVTKTIRYIVVIFLTIAIARIDIKKCIIPNVSVLFLFSFQIILLFIEFFTDRASWTAIIFSSLIGLLIGGVTFLVGYVISRQGMGLGDVKLLSAMGFCLGDTTIVAIIMFSLLMAAIYGIIQLLRKKKKYKDEMPFAPFVAIATTILLLLGF